MSTATGGFGLRRIGQIMITAHDLERAVRFYRDTLGMSFLFQVPQMAFFDCGGIRVMLGVPEHPTFDHPASVIYYQVDDIQAAHRELETRGVAVMTAPHLVAKLERVDLWLSNYHDSEGNILALMSEVPR